MVIMWLLKDF